MKNFVIWLFLTTDLFLKIISSLSIVIFINYLFLTNNVGDNSINLIGIDGSIKSILPSILSTIINIFVLSIILILEYIMCNWMLMLRLNKEEMLFEKYFFVGVMSNFLYFLLTIGLDYVPKLIDNKIFLKY